MSLRGPAIAARRRMPAALAAGALLLALVPVSARGQDQRASLPDIEDEVMCPICGTTLELSESPQAERERELIRRLIAEGKDKEQIKDALVAEYGADVLALPEGEGFDAAAWLVPAVGLALAALGIGIGLVRVRRRRDRTSESTAELSEDERRRLEADLSAFDR